MAKVGGAVGLIGSKMNVFQDILNLLHQISMKLWGNVLGMKRKKTDQFDHMFAHSCPSMPIIYAQIRPFLVPQYTIFNISRIWLIRFRWNFVEMFMVWKEWRLMSLVTCSPILAQACPSFRPKLGHIWSQNIPFSIYLEFGSDFQEMFLV